MTQESENENQERDAETTETSETESQETSTREKSTQASDDATSDEQREQDEQTIQDAKDDGASPEEVEKIRKALHKANKESQKRREQLNEWSELNTTPDEVKKLLEERREAEIKKAEEEGRYQDLLDQYKQENAQEREKVEKQLQEKEQVIDKLTRRTKISDAVNAEKGIPEMLYNKLEAETKTIYDNDMPTAIVVDEYGQPRTKEDGEYMSVDDRVKELKDDPVWSHAFPAPKTSGSGTSATGASKASKNSGAKPTKPKSQMSLEEKAAYVKEHGPKAFEELPYH